MAGNLLGYWGQTSTGPTGGGGAGNLTGNTYEGAFGNSVSGGIPGIGGSLEGILSAVYGSKYNVPNPTATAGEAIGGNLGNLGADTSLTLGTDTTSAEGAALPYQMNLPGYEGQLASESANVSNELAGDLPSSVQNQLQQDASEYGVQTGQGAGSPNENAALLQSLGLTSLNMTQMGQQGLAQEIGTTPTGAQFNPASMYVTPEQEQAAQLAANQEAAAPDPQAAGLMDTLTSFF